MGEKSQRNSGAIASRLRVLGFKLPPAMATLAMANDTAAQTLFRKKSNAIGNPSIKIR
jgi:hypothetical protein